MMENLQSALEGAVVWVAAARAGLRPRMRHQKGIGVGQEAREGELLVSGPRGRLRRWQVLLQR